jgi:hypothetical protein
MDFKNDLKDKYTFVSLNNKMDFIILYTFDMPSNPNWHEHPKMLMMSILSSIREFKKYNFKIIIYTTNTDSLYNYLKQYNILDYILIKKYSPSNYGVPEILPLDKKYEPFINGIGHARIFVLKELRKHYKCPIVYMDNDTGISLGKGEECFEMIMQTKTIRYYALEKWITFSELYSKMGQYDELIGFHNKYPSLIKHNINPRNNGIIIYGYTNNNEINNKFVDNAILLIENVYNILSRGIKSHYNDMFAFSIVCDILALNDSISNVIENNEGPFKFIIKETPIFIHYYINKYSFMDLIDYIFDKVIKLYIKNKPLELNEDCKVINSKFMLKSVFSNELTNQDEIELFMNKNYS